MADGRNVTVFGGSGFIGRDLVQRLAARGDIVRVVVRDPQRAKFLKPLGEAGQIVLLAGDIRDDESVAAAVKDADAVVNLVGILYESGFGARRLTFDDIHHHGARRVARASRSAEVKNLVHVSAIGADRESSAAYARTKAAGEDAVRFTFPDAVILRPSVVFGPNDDFFNRFAKLMRLTLFLPVFGCGAPRLERPEGGGLPVLNLYGNGGVRFQPVYVGDVGEAILRAMEDPAAMGELYELGGPRIYTFKELMELLMAETGRRRVLVPVPFWLANINALFFEHLPKPLLTRDQVKLMRRDNVVGERAQGFAKLGITPTAVEVILPTYLARFRAGGAFRQAGAKS